MISRCRFLTQACAGHQHIGSGRRRNNVVHDKVPVQPCAHVVLRVPHGVGRLLGEAAQAVGNGCLLGKQDIGGSRIGTSRSGGEPAPGQSTAAKGYGKAVLVLRGVDIKCSVQWVAFLLSGLTLALCLALPCHFSFCTLHLLPLVSRHCLTRSFCHSSCVLYSSDY